MNDFQDPKLTISCLTDEELKEFAKYSGNEGKPLPTHAARLHSRHSDLPSATFYGSSWIQVAAAASAHILRYAPFGTMVSHLGRSRRDDE